MQASPKVPSCAIADKIYLFAWQEQSPTCRPARDLLDAGVHSFGSENEKDKGLPKDPAAQIHLLMRKLEHDEGGTTHAAGYHQDRAASPPLEADSKSAC